MEKESRIIRLIDDDNFWVVSGLCAVLAAMCFIGYFGFQNNIQNNKNFIDGGYEKQTLQGAAGTVWVKINPCPCDSTKGTK